MRAFHRFVLIAPAALVVTLAACGKKKTLPPAMIGSYERQEPSPLGILISTAHLYLTPTGISVTGPSAGMSQSMELGDTPVLRGKIQMGSSGSALFASIRCDDDNNCSFETKNGCEGTITRSTSGDIVLVVMGDCSAWAGKWVPEKPHEPARAASMGSTARPPSPDPPSPSGLPDPSRSLPEPPSSPPAPPAMDCLTACNVASLGCLKNCKMGDSACMQGCNDEAMSCAQRC